MTSVYTVLFDGSPTKLLFANSQGYWGPILNRITIKILQQRDKLDFFDSYDQQMFAFIVGVARKRNSMFNILSLNLQPLNIMVPVVRPTLCRLPKCYTRLENSSTRNKRPSFICILCVI